MYARLNDLASQALSKADMERVDPSKRTLVKDPHYPEVSVMDPSVININEYRRIISDGIGIAYHDNQMKQKQEYLAYPFQRSDWPYSDTHMSQQEKVEDVDYLVRELARENRRTDLVRSTRHCSIDQDMIGIMGDKELEWIWTAAPPGTRRPGALHDSSVAKQYYTNVFLYKRVVAAYRELVTNYNNENEDEDEDKWVGGVDSDFWHKDSLLFWSDDLGLGIEWLHAEIATAKVAKDIHLSALSSLKILMNRFFIKDFWTMSVVMQSEEFIEQHWSAEHFPYVEHFCDVVSPLIFEQPVPQVMHDAVRIILNFKKPYKHAATSVVHFQLWEKNATQIAVFFFLERSIEYYDKVEGAYEVAVPKLFMLREFDTDVKLKILEYAWGTECPMIKAIRKLTAMVWLRSFVFESKSYLIRPEEAAKAAKAEAARAAAKAEAEASAASAMAF